MIDAERSRLARLAVADWSEAAEAYVDWVVVLCGRAAVNLFLNGDHAYAVYFQRDEGGEWYDAGSSSGHADVTQLEYLDEDA